MAFARKIWKLLVAIKDGLVLAFMLLFFVALFGVLNARPNPAAVRDGALVLDLDGFVVEERSVIDPISAILSSSAPITEYPVRDIVHALDRAADDDRIDAVVLDLTAFLGGGHVHMQDIAEAISRVREAEKPVLTYAVAYGDDAMMIASHASEVWIDPQGGAAIAGPGGQRLYYAELLERIGITARVYRAGTYKSAVEPYIETGMSDAARENYTALYGSLWEEYLAKLRRARPDAELARVTQDPAAWLDRFAGDTARASQEAGLVDRIGDRVQFGERVAEIAGEDMWDDGPGSYPSTSLETWLADNPYDNTGSAIGVVTIAGEIVDGDAGPGSAGGRRIANLLDEALSRDLAGLVVRVDSPGGSVLASEEIRRAILRHKGKGIPIAVSMGNVAASGGYWVSTPGDRIFAEPETITGSIGVFGVVPTFEDALDKLGVGTDGVRTTSLSGQPDILGGFTPEFDRIMQSGVENTYARFVNLVAYTRDKTSAHVDEVGQGRVWDGGTARQLGLVDAFGGIDDALAWVAAEAKLEDGDWYADYLASPADIPLWLSALAGDRQSSTPRDLFAVMAGDRTGALAQVERDLTRLLTTRGVQAYCLECPTPAAARYGAGGQRGAPAEAGWLARFVAWLPH